MQHKGLRPATETSAAKIFNSELFQRIAGRLMELLGLNGALGRGEDSAPLQGGIASLYLYTISRTISAGTSEIQRNIIATRGLGLPR
jgi:alkylation response protein AidB-like acyl-CoA dehydrogenase